MKQPYYDSEIIEVTIKIKVSWEAGNEEAREYVIGLAKESEGPQFVGAHVKHGCYRVEKV